MKDFLAVVGAATLFIILWAFVDWIAGVTAPVLGPLVLAAMIYGLIVLFIREANKLKRDTPTEYRNRTK